MAGRHPARACAVHRDADDPRVDDATKAATYTTVAEDLSACGVRREDIIIAVTEHGGSAGRAC